MEKSEAENKLKKINELYDAGLITKSEYNELLKSEVMGSNTKGSSNTDYKLLFKILTGLSVLLALYSVFIFFSLSTSENKVNSQDIIAPSAADDTKKFEVNIGKNSEEDFVASAVDTTKKLGDNISGDIQETTERKSSNTIQIGNQIWTTRNLDVSTYRNGDIIPEVQDADEWANLTTGAWCYYDNKSENGAIYGKLYNWYAVNDPRGLAPEGYHIPTEEEWEKLINHLGIEPGKKMKSLSGWNENLNGTNASGFNGLPGGYRMAGQYTDFGTIGSIGEWWSSTGNIKTKYRDAFFISLYIHHYSDKEDNGLNVGGFLTTPLIGKSVRCIKN